MYVGLFTEPTGRTGPKVTGDGLNRQIGQSDESLALLCDVQAFPAPLTRYGRTRLSRRRPAVSHVHPSRSQTMPSDVLICVVIAVCCGGLMEA